MMIWCVWAPGESQADQAQSLRIGIIGLDTSHAIAFTREFNRDPAGDEAFRNLTVVAAYPHGSADIETSASRIPNYTADIQELGVEVVDSIAELLDRVDCVLLETNDGRLHLEQALRYFEPTSRFLSTNQLARTWPRLLPSSRRPNILVCPCFQVHPYGTATVRKKSVPASSVASSVAIATAHVRWKRPTLTCFGMEFTESSRCTPAWVRDAGPSLILRPTTSSWPWDSGPTDASARFAEPVPARAGYGGTAFGEKGIGQIGCLRWLQTACDSDRQVLSYFTGKPD